jgi:hypothetical protein
MTLHAEGTGHGVEYVREDLLMVMPKYDLIKDVLEGQFAVKAGTVKYLPVPNGNVKETDDRYKAYVLRAVLYNVTHRTTAGLVGQVFLRPPVIEIPDLLRPIIDDANGANMDIRQMSQMSVTHVIAYGRAGLFTDYSATNGEASREDIVKGIVRPTINFYAPWNIINWKRTEIESRNMLSLVVLREDKIEEVGDGFAVEFKVQYRVLRLFRNEDNELCTRVEVWFNPKDEEFEIVEEYDICDAEGTPLGEIPFDFMGSNNNDDVIDEPPMFDIAVLNIAHYRNSADFEESCFMLGQPTPYFAGLSEHWVNEVLKGEIILGSRSAIPLPEGGSAGLLEVTPNTMAREAMEHKESQMFALGAKLVQQRIIEATATEVEIQNASENSVLAQAGKNVTDAFTKALERSAAYIGVPTETIKFELNTNFDLTTMTPDELRIVLEAWASFGAISTNEMRESVRRNGIGSLTDKEYVTSAPLDKAFKDRLGLNNTQNNSDNRSVTTAAE